LHNFSYRLLIYRKPGIDIAKIRKRNVEDLATPDLDIYFDYKQEDQDRFRIVFYPKDDQLSVLAKQIRSSRADWTVTGRIVGGNDLAGAQLFLEVSNLSAASGSLQTVINVANEYELDENDFRTVRGPGSDEFVPSVYEFRFPVDGDSTHFRLAQSQARRKREEQDAKKLKALVAQRWCDMNTVEADVRPGDASEGAVREMCIRDVRTNGGRAPAASEDQSDSENGSYLYWKHARGASATALACGCTVDWSHQNTSP
jgi:hypothetical protein